MICDHFLTALMLGYDHYLNSWIELTNNLAIRISTNKYAIEDVKTINGRPFKLINIPVYAAGKVRSIIEDFG